MELHDIKDKSPNKSLIKEIEKVLESAKLGEIRSLMWISGWHDNAVTHGWAYDDRTYLRPLLAELVMLQHNFIVNIELGDGDTMLTRALDKE